MKTKLAAAPKIELRRVTRYRLVAPAHFWWGTAEQIGGNRKGMTRDVSTAGAFLTASLCPPVGARVEIDILLPRMNGTAVGVRLHGEGTVLRVDHVNSKAKGFAAALHFYPEAPDESVLSNDGRS